MITEERKKQAEKNFARYLDEGLLKKQQNSIAMKQYMENAEMSLRTSQKLMSSPESTLWVIVISYYAMFYAANATLLHLGYKTQDKIAHQVTYDALIVLILRRLKTGLLESFKEIQDDALDIARSRSEDVVESYDLERRKRSTFQYNMLEKVKESKATTSMRRASEFVFEMKKLMG